MATDQYIISINIGNSNPYLTNPHPILAIGYNLIPHTAAKMIATPRTGLRARDEKRACVFEYHNFYYLCFDILPLKTYLRGRPHKLGWWNR